MICNKKGVRGWYSLVEVDTVLGVSEAGEHHSSTFKITFLDISALIDMECQ